MSWQIKASCRGTDPNLFFDAFEDATMSEKINVLKVCANCPVRRECYDAALSMKDTHGIWGGYFFRDGKPKDALKIKKSKMVQFN